MKCRHCNSPLSQPFVDLGFAPPSNAYLTLEDLSRPETSYPLRVMVCTNCWLVQTEDYTDAGDLFGADYAYFSSTSKGWLAHAASFSEMITDRLGLSRESFVVELAANDGYLLRNFVAAGIPCLGIEPTESTADAALAQGIPIRRQFFSQELGETMARAGEGADLVIGNNVYAHVPDINGFTRGIAALLKPQGIVTLEFPHLLRLVADCQFDTIYHEHFSYIGLTTLSRIFRSAGLRVFDVEELSTHGGSLRVYGCRDEADYRDTDAVNRTLGNEADSGLTKPETYCAFQARADALKDRLLAFLIEKKSEGKSIVGYGAAAKGNTLLNYAGVKPDLLPYVCDAAPQKQGKFLPGTHIPIRAPGVLAESAPDYLLVLPWNIADEVMRQLAFLRERGTWFVTAIPELRIR